MDTPEIRCACTDDGVDIAYAVLGSGHPGPPVVVVNALIDAGIDAQLASELEMEAYAGIVEARKTVIFDWRGVGVSAAASDGHSRDGLLRDLAAVVDSVGEPQVDLCLRFSLCHIGVHYAAANPARIRRMVLIQPAEVGSSARVNPRFAPIAHMAYENWDWFAETLALLTRGWQDTALARAFYRRIRSRYDAASWNALMDICESLDCSEDAPLVQCPTLVHYTGSPPQPIRALAARIPGARLVVQPHSPMMPLMTRWIPEVAVGFLNAAEVPEDASTVAPSAFQTIMFTDLESSTALTQRLGDHAAQEVLRGHNATVRKALEAHGGREVKHTGDGIMAAFPSAVRAVEAALQIQRDLAGGEVRVRVGLNAGEPIAEDDDLFGTAVQLAARICDRAEPGQVLVSRVVADLCAGKRLQFTHHSDATLKGFAEPVVLYEVQ